MPTVFDKQGRPVTLGTELGRGGEASVYEVTGRADTVAKIYHKPPGPEKAAKIAAMVASPSDRLLNIAAWPIGTVHQNPGTVVCGLLMPKLSGFQEVHTLYGPKSRLTHFPNATWPFLVHAALNAARAFAVIHDLGHVIGDVNQSNLHVSDKATVKLIDCDSFQISQNGHSYLCEVGVPTHTPPELQGQPFRSITRTPNHDNFGLAVVIFQLLFMGRHPFSGQFLGPGEMSIEKAISEFRFAYGAGAAARQMRPPPATLPLVAASDQVATLFEGAFAPGGAKAGGRPRAQDWVIGLSAVAKSIKSCSRNTGHQYLAALPQCPWCEVESKSGIVLFNAVIIGARMSAGTFDLDAIWLQIRAVPHPGPLPPLAAPTVQVMPSLVVREARQQRLTRRWICYGAITLLGTITAAGFGTAAALTLVIITAVICILIASSFANSPCKKLRPQRQQVLKAAETQFQFTEQRWTREAASQGFEAKYRELEAAKGQLAGLEAQRQSRLRQLDLDRANKQLERHMDRLKIQDVSIDGIGQGRVATLQSYGIETAGDIVENTILSIPGFGPSLTSRLMAWRWVHEQKFVFNPNVGVNPADVAVVEQEFTALKMKLEQELRNGPLTLQQMSQQIRQMRETLRPGLDQATRSLAVARADYAAVK